MKKILLVDDSKDIHKILEALIRKSFKVDFLIASAHSGNEALAVLSQNSFDIIICDLEMKDGDGIFLLRALESLRVESPFVFFTSTPENAPRVNQGILKAVVSKAAPREIVLEIEKYLEVFANG